ncbi:D-sedoheptulose-7-phosphate isomerase [Amnimonas aquatica]|uniref:Phosphoheptose isomerase n=1 Tax=Amnimonas aquatica TaxID=2094561 RepID=A0A2P6AS82_9GAMM|nr:SIS domain-containing protein [Amnimonas aquatica]PQA41609.1 phosphoheptose isomerase [Amnimonas aquatica]
MQARITQLCQDSMTMLARLAEEQSGTISQAAMLMVDALVQERKLICCGNGASGANALSFVSKLLNRFEHERPALPALALAPDSITLSALAQDNRLTESFSRPFLAYAQPGDVLVVLSASANAANILSVIQAAHERHCPVIALTGNHGGEVARLLEPQDVLIQLPEHRSYRVHEAQLFTLHCCCALIDTALFGDPDLV